MIKSENARPNAWVFVDLTDDLRRAVKDTGVTSEEIGVRAKADFQKAGVPLQAPWIQ